MLEIHDVLMAVVQIVDDADVLGVVLSEEKLADRDHVLRLAAPAAMVVEAKLALHFRGALNERQQLLGGSRDAFFLTGRFRRRKRLPYLRMQAVFAEKFECLFVRSPESEVLESLLLVLKDFVFKRGDMIVAPIVGDLGEAELLEHFGPFRGTTVFSVERHDTPGDEVGALEDGRFVGTPSRSDNDRQRHGENGYDERLQSMNFLYRLDSIGPLHSDDATGSVGSPDSCVKAPPGINSMKTATGVTLITNGTLIDGTGSPPVPNAAVMVCDGRIDFAGPARDLPPVEADAKRIDADGGAIMPGLVEAHFHSTYFNVAALEDLDIKYPVEFVTLLAAANAKLALECGYTAARSGGSLFNIDVWLKKAIESDVCPGPRLASSGREICGVGGLMDWNPDFRKIGMEGLVLLVNGPEEARAAVRKLVKDGVEWVKTYPTGDAAAPDTNDHHTLCMTFEEMNAVVATAHNHRMKVTGHCRATAGIKNALRAGYDAIEHGTFMDAEALDLLLSRDVPCVPALYFEMASIEHGPAFGMSQRVIDGHQETLDGGAESARMIIKAGGRLGMGGDYGFAWNPHGDYAKELTFFVRDVGLDPLTVLRCATKTGAEIMGRADEFGTVEPGKLADLLIVAGDVLADIAILEDRSKFLAVLQGGIIKAGRLASGAGA